MKRHQVLAISLLLNVLFLYSSASTQESKELSDVVSDVRGINKFEITIHPDLPTYVFRLIGNPDLNVIDHIEVLTTKNPTKIIQVLASFDMEPPYRDAEYFQAEDINFDGYMDIKILRYWGATGNEYWNYWLFDKKKKKFIFNKALSELCSPHADSVKKEISTYCKGGMAGGIYTIELYKIKGDKLSLIREEQQDWISEKNYFLRITKERRKGKMVITDREIIKEW